MSPQYLVERTVAVVQVAAVEAPNQEEAVKAAEHGDYRLVKEHKTVGSPRGWSVQRGSKK